MEFSSDDYSPLYNESEFHDPELELSAFNFYYALCTTLTFCISLSGNSFLLWVLLRERAWRAPPDIFHLQLTVSNLCFTASLPFAACDSLHGWIFGKLACAIILEVFLLGQYSYVGILTAMTLHHYGTVLGASWLPAQTSSKFRVLLVSAFIWLVCAAAGIQWSVNSTVLEFSNMKVCTTSINSHVLVLFGLYVAMILFFLIPFIINTFCFIHMWETIKQRRTNRHEQPSKLILGMNVGFFLCMTPRFISHFIHSLLFLEVLQYTGTWVEAIFKVMHILEPLKDFYCCLNPLVYMFGTQRFRRYLHMPCDASSRRRDGGNDVNSFAFTPLHTTE